MKKIYIFLFLFFISVSSISCTSKQKKDLINKGFDEEEIDEALDSVSASLISTATSYEVEFFLKYGQRNAINTFSFANNIWQSGELSYNIHGVRPDYLDPVKKAIQQANKTVKEYSTCTIKYSTSSGKQSIVTLDYCLDDNGKPKLDVNADCNICTKDIRISTKNVDKYNSYKSKVHITLHELGHALNLGDLNTFEEDGQTKTFEQYSVMYCVFNNTNKYAFTDFTKFDKANIDWLADQLGAGK